MLFTKTQRILLGIILFRLISWFIVRTYFIPDEYWQTFEIAHSLAFGYGYQTWEWKSDIAIRSYLYPFIISLIYRILAFFNLDTASILINSATLFQTFLVFLGDLAYLKFLHGHKLIFLILLCRFTCWYTMYSSPRLLINNLEEILFICSLASAKKYII
jgi:phosphatidylinositol glycan class B